MLKPDNFLLNFGKRSPLFIARRGPTLAAMNPSSPASFYDEPAKRLPVIDEADVLVVGGGPGGVGAAVAAARNGVRTILVERFGSFGGTWTSGLLSAIMPFPYVRGIFAELAEAMQNAGSWNSSSKEYGWGASYDAETAKIVLDRLVTQSGVIPYFFTQVADVIREGGRVTGVIVESKEGRAVIRAKMVIDSSGDGDVCARAGAAFAHGREGDGATQPMTMIFTMSGVDTPRATAQQDIDRDCAKIWQAAKARGEIDVPREDVLHSPNPRPGVWNFNATRIVGKDGTKVRDVTEAMIEGRRQVAQIAEFMRKHRPGFENAVVQETAAHIGVRETRRILCDHTIVADDIIKVPPFEDCIARGNWFIDIHSPTGEGTVRIHPPAGKWYEIPYRSIRPRGLENVLVASRCIDSTHEAHAAVRITPQVMAIGQGAGTAAALCVKHGLQSTRALEAATLRAKLREQGAFV